jgi:hypothetical protein
LKNDEKEDEEENVQKSIESDLNSTMKRQQLEYIIRPSPAKKSLKND